MKTRSPLWIFLFYLLSGLSLFVVLDPSNAQADGNQDPARNQGSVRVTRLSPDFPGPLRSGRMTPFPVVVESLSSGFRGQIVLRSFFSEPPPRSYRLPFEIGPHTKKVLWPCFRPEGPHVQIEIEDEKGRLLSGETITTNLQAAGIHVLSIGSPGKLRSALANSKIDLTGQLSVWERAANLSYSRPEILSLPSGHLPDRRLSLEFVDAIVISETDLEALPPSFVSALHDFCTGGGNLIVSHPENFPVQPLSSKWDYLPVRMLERTVVEDLSELEPLAATPRRGTSVAIAPGEGFGRGSFSSARIGVLGEVLARSGAHPLVVRSQSGLGSITYLNFDLSREPFWESSATTSFLEWLLLPSFPFEFGAVELDRAILEALEASTPQRRIPLGAIFLFLGLYLATIGPVNSLILSRKGKKELGAITTPCIAVVFLGIAYFFGYFVHGREPQIVKQEIAFLPRGEGKARIESFLALHSPGVVSFALSGEDGEDSAFAVYAPSNRTDRLDLEAEIWIEESVSLKNVQTAMWSKRYLRSQSLRQTKNLSITLTPSETPNHYDLEIQNELGAPLTKALLWTSENTVVDLGVISEGTCLLSHPLRPADAFQLRTPLGAWFDTGYQAQATPPVNDGITSTTSRVTEASPSPRVLDGIQIALGIWWKPRPTSPFLLTGLVEDRALDPIQLDGDLIPTRSRTFVLQEVQLEERR